MGAGALVHLAPPSSACGDSGGKCDPWLRLQPLACSLEPSTQGSGAERRPCTPQARDNFLLTEHAHEP